MSVSKSVKSFTFDLSYYILMCLALALVQLVAFQTILSRRGVLFHFVFTTSSSSHDNLSKAFQLHSLQASLWLLFMSKQVKVAMK